MPADSSPVTIRPATPADVDLMVEHTWTVAAEGRWLGTEVPFDRAERGRRLDLTIAGPDSAAFVADASAAGDQPVVGFATVHLAPYGVADLGMLIVERWRGRGVGRGLLGAAIGWAREAGAHKMTLEVWPHNQAGRRLYERFGFVEEGRKVRHYRRRNGEIWDAVLMGLPLG